MPRGGRRHRRHRRARRRHRRRQRPRSRGRPAPPDRHRLDSRLPRRHHPWPTPARRSGCPATSSFPPPSSTRSPRRTPPASRPASCWKGPTDRRRRRPTPSSPTRGSSSSPTSTANAGGVIVSYFEWLKNLSHIGFGRIEKRHQESTYSRILGAIETATGDRLTPEQRAAVIRGPDELTVVNSGLEEIMSVAYRAIASSSPGCRARRRGGGAPPGVGPAGVRADGASYSALQGCGAGRRSPKGRLRRRPRRPSTVHAQITMRSISSTVTVSAVRS